MGYSIVLCSSKLWEIILIIKMNEENVSDIPELLLLISVVSFLCFPITLISSCVFWFLSGLKLLNVPFIC